MLLINCVHGHGSLVQQGWLAGCGGGEKLSLSQQSLTSNAITDNIHWSGISCWLCWLWGMHTVYIVCVRQRLLMRKVRFGWDVAPQRHAPTVTYSYVRFLWFNRKSELVLRWWWWTLKSSFDFLDPVATLICDCNNTPILVLFCISLLLKEISDLCSMRQSIVPL